MIPVKVHGCFLEAFFRRVFWSVFLRFWCDFGRFWEAKMEVLGRFREVFAKLFRARFRHRFLIEFLMLETLKIAILPRKNNDFCKIDVFEQLSKKHRCWMHFRRAKRRKIDARSFSKLLFFQHRFLCVCLRILAILAPFWEAKTLPKNCQKSKKS